MTKPLVASALLGMAAPSAFAGGLDRTGLGIDLLFEPGNYAEFGFVQTTPSLSGTGSGNAVAWPGNPAGRIGAGSRYEGVGVDFSNISAGVKFDLSSRLSAAVLFEQPFGSDIEYNGAPDTTELGGTVAIANTDMVTAMLRYRLDENWSAHGGLRLSRANGDIKLSGLAYGIPQAAVPGGAPVFAGGFNGYSVALENGYALGWMIGGAYEVPEIALRVAVTYNSPITHDLDTEEFYLGSRIGQSSTEVQLPRSLNIDVQTGIAEDTLLFGSYRWAEWSNFKIDPQLFTPAAGAGLVDLDDSHTYTIGVGRRFTEQFAAQLSFTYEPQREDNLVSPLAPTDGVFAVGLGGSYEVSEQVVLSGGLRYNWIGNARPETGTPDTERARFDDNTALSLGVSVGYRF